LYKFESNHRNSTKVEPSRQVPRALAARPELVLLGVTGIRKSAEKRELTHFQVHFLTHFQVMCSEKKPLSCFAHWLLNGAFKGKK